MDDFAVAEATGGLVALLERHCADFPQLGEELERQRRLRDTVAEQRERSAQALAAWRAALARRWRCEVAAQRIYADAQRRLRRYYNDRPSHARLVAPGDPDHARTPGGLLQEVLRLAATLEVLAPSLPCAAELRADLRAAADDLAAAIEQTDTARSSVVACIPRSGWPLRWRCEQVNGVAGCSASTSVKRLSAERSPGGLIPPGARAAEMRRAQPSSRGLGKPGLPGPSPGGRVWEGTALKQGPEETGFPQTFAQRVGVGQAPPPRGCGPEDGWFRPVS